MTEQNQTVSPEHEYLGAGKSLAYGLQHVLTMYGGIIAPPLIIGTAAGLEPAQIGLLIAAALFVGGLATILQTVGVKYIRCKITPSSRRILCWCGNDDCHSHCRWWAFGSIWCGYCCFINRFLFSTIFFKNYSFFPANRDRLRDYRDWFVIATCRSTLDDGWK